MGQALYRKYRSKSLDTVVGQEHITATLAHALKSGKLAHAYLFTGPRGVGKTSIARILAHEINGLPYIDDSMHLDIIEIDAASNRRIDEIRDLRDKVNVAPAIAKYKVYIIDEVHMLTREAFNALLKTLEEPPAHAVFILATTESHKLPETIVSRTQRFMFKPVAMDKVVAHLRTIADAEGLRIDDEALVLVAAYGEGSFRDSISLLDQTRGHDGTVDGSYVRSLIGLPTDEAIGAVCSALEQHDAARLSLTLAGLRDQGFAAAQVAKHLSQRLRDDILQGSIGASTFGLLQKLLEVPTSYESQTFLELILLEHALAGRPASPAPPTLPTPLLSSDETTKTAKAAKIDQPAKQPALAPLPAKPASASASAKPAPKPATATPPPATSAISAPLDDATWQLVLDRLKKTHNTLYGIARMSRPVFQTDSVILHFKFAFHRKRLNEAKNRDIVLSAIREQTGREILIKCLMEDAAATAPAGASVGAAADPAGTKAPHSQPADAKNSLATISTIFGGAEVLEK